MAAGPLLPSLPPTEFFGSFLTPGSRATSITGFKSSHTLGPPWQGSEDEPHPCPALCPGKEGARGTRGPPAKPGFCAQLGSLPGLSPGAEAGCARPGSLLPVTEPAGPRHTPRSSALQHQIALSWGETRPPPALCTQRPLASLEGINLRVLRAFRVAWRGAQAASVRCTHHGGVRLPPCRGHARSEGGSGSVCPSRGSGSGRNQESAHFSFRGAPGRKLQSAGDAAGSPGPGALHWGSWPCSGLSETELLQWRARQPQRQRRPPGIGDGGGLPTCHVPRLHCVMSLLGGRHVCFCSMR